MAPALLAAVIEDPAADPAWALALAPACAGRAVCVVAGMAVLPPALLAALAPPALLGIACVLIAVLSAVDAAPALAGGALEQLTLTSQQAAAVSCQVTSRTRMFRPIDDLSQ